jgi:hypothetical protein
LTDGEVILASEEKAPDFDTIVKNIVKMQKNGKKFAIFNQQVEIIAKKIVISTKLFFERSI